MLRGFFIIIMLIILYGLKKVHVINSKKDRRDYIEYKVYIIIGCIVYINSLYHDLTHHFTYATDIYMSTYYPHVKEEEASVNVKIYICNFMHLRLGSFFKFVFNPITSTIYIK